MSQSLSFSKTSGKSIKYNLQVVFDEIWSNEVCKEKVGVDGVNHNKLRTYCKIKNTFGTPLYVAGIRNRNQRMWLSRLRTSSHTLEIELGRYNGVPIEDRICRYCTQNKVDDEFHFLLKCNTFESLRIAYFEKIQLLNPTINMLEENQKFVSQLDPKSIQEAKITNITKVHQSSF